MGIPASVRIHVVSAVSGERLLARDYGCDSCNQTLLIEMLLRDLGHRPSRQYTLFLDGVPIDADFVPGEVGEVKISASISQGMTFEDRHSLVDAMRYAACSKDGMVPRILQGAGLVACDDPFIVLAAVRLDWRAFRMASDLCKNDKEIVLAAVRQDGGALADAGHACLDDREIVLTAVRQDVRSLRYAGQVLKDDKEIGLAALETSEAELSELLMYIGPRVKHDSEIQLVAINALERQLFRERNFYRFATDYEEQRRGHWCNFMRAMGSPGALAAVQWDGNLLEFVQGCDGGLEMGCGRYLDIVCAAVRQNGMALQFAGFGFDAELEIVLEAVRQNGMALRLASYGLRDDRRVVLEAVRQNCGSLPFASTALQADELILAEVGRKRSRT